MFISFSYTIKGKSEPLDHPISGLTIMRNDYLIFLDSFINYFGNTAIMTIHKLQKALAMPIIQVLIK